MDDDEIWARVDAQRAELADLLDALSSKQWATQSLCADWTVRDVAVHLTQSTGSWLRFGVEAVRSGFRFDPMMSRLARRDTSAPDEITTALRATIGVRRRPPGTTVVDPLMDLLVHGQDIAVPLGLTRAMPVDEAVVVARRLWRMRFPLHPRKRFGGPRVGCLGRRLAGRRRTAGDRSRRRRRAGAGRARGGIGQAVGRGHGPLTTAE